VTLVENHLKIFKLYSHKSPLATVSRIFLDINHYSLSSILENIYVVCCAMCDRREGCGGSSGVTRGVWVTLGSHRRPIFTLSVSGFIHDVLVRQENHSRPQSSSHFEKWVSISSHSLCRNICSL
jgi:hypothetical protein